MLERLQALAIALEGVQEAIIFPHNDPDPDAMASAMGIRYLLAERFSIQSQIVYQGIIGRAENRALERYLEYPLTPLEENWQQRGLPLIMVDTQPGAGNNPIEEGKQVTAVFDHHPLLPETAAAKFSDVRAGLGATGTIVMQYLQAANLPIPAQVATALMYAIKTDTLCLTRGVTAEDTTAFLELQPFVDQVALLRVERAQVSIDYFRAFDQALGAAILYQDVLFANIGQMLYPDWAAEMADWLLRLETVRWVICTGVFGNALYLAIRTRSLEGGAGKLAQYIVGRRGVAGGHGTMAGGQMWLRDDAAELLVERVRQRALQRLNVSKDVQGLRLVNDNGRPSETL